MTAVIAINGFKRSGKGETGNAIVSVAQDYSQHAVTLGFADKLKIAACRNLGLLNWSDAECVAYMDEFKEQGIIEFSCSTEADDAQVISGRQYLQWMGTEYRKLFGEDFWIDQVLPHAESNVPAELFMRYGRTDYVVFTDCRFPNEARRTLDLGGEVWEVIHPAAASDGHESEQPLSRELVTRQIVNDGTLMDLRYKVEQALNL